MSSTDVSTIEKESEEEDDTTGNPVTNALDYENELKRIIAGFNSTDEILRYLKKIGNFPSILKISKI